MKLKIDEMNLEQVTKRLADLDEEVRTMTKAEDVDKATEEKKALLEKQAELFNLEQRRKTALDLEAGKIIGKKIDERRDEKPMEFEKETVLSTPEYRSAWLKSLQGKELNDVEQRSVAATNVSGAIPTETYNAILAKIKQTVPLLDEITLLHVAGNVNFAVEGTNNAAAIHTENGEVTPAADTLVTVSLAGYEIVKIVRISATVKTMTINAFESWLSDMLAEAVARVIENYIINGSGSSEPKGVAQAQTWTDGTNGVDWASTKPTYAELVELVSYLPGGYARNAKFLMNHKTFWGDIQAIRDDGKAPIVASDNGGYRVMGFPVLFSDYVADGDIYFGDFKKIVANLAQDISVAASAESGFIYNAIDYRGAAIFDCDVAIGEAFVKGEATLSNS